jgi:hypothetical protein
MPAAHRHPLLRVLDEVPGEDHLGFGHLAAELDSTSVETWKDKALERAVAATLVKIFVTYVAC